MDLYRIWWQCPKCTRLMHVQLYWIQCRFAFVSGYHFYMTLYCTCAGRYTATLDFFDSFPIIFCLGLIQRMTAMIVSNRSYFTGRPILYSMAKLIKHLAPTKLPTSPEPILISMAYSQYSVLQNSTSHTTVSYEKTANMKQKRMIKLRCLPILWYISGIWSSTFSRCSTLYSHCSAIGGTRLNWRATEYASCVTPQHNHHVIMLMYC